MPCSCQPSAVTALCSVAAPPLLPCRSVGPDLWCLASCCAQTRWPKASLALANLGLSSNASCRPLPCTPRRSVFEDIPVAPLLAGPERTHSRFLEKTRPLLLRSVNARRDPIRCVPSLLPPPSAAVLLRSAGHGVRQLRCAALRTARYCTSKGSLGSDLVLLNQRNAPGPLLHLGHHTPSFTHGTTSWKDVFECVASDLVHTLRRRRRHVFPIPIPNSGPARLGFRRGDSPRAPTPQTNPLPKTDAGLSEVGSGSSKLLASSRRALSCLALP